MAHTSVERVAEKVGLPAEELSKPCDNQTIPLLADCFIEWRVIFASLLSEIDLGDVTRENPNSEREKRIAALRKWKNSNGGGATYKVLASVLLSNGNKDQAESLCKILANQLSQRQPSEYHILAASRSEPHTSQLNRDFFFPFICTQV